MSVFFTVYGPYTVMSSAAYVTQKFSEKAVKDSGAQKTHLHIRKDKLENTLNYDARFFYIINLLLLDILCYFCAKPFKV